MPWYVGFSIGACTTVFIGFLGLLALTSFHLWNQELNIPLEGSDQWMTHITALIPVSILCMVLCGVFLWTIITKDWIRFFIGTLVVNFLCLATTVYFAVVFATELDAVQMSGETLFAKTRTSIVENVAKTGNSTWLPRWLDHVQKHSKECCGIQTFRDWEEFWPLAPSGVPPSCCIDPANLSTYCPTDLSRIPFPGTPSMFIKTDTGCLDELNGAAKRNYYQCFVYTTILCGLVALSEIAYLIQFYKQYIPFSLPFPKAYFNPKNNCDDEENKRDKGKGGKGDVNIIDGGGGGGGSPNAGSYIELAGFSTGSLGTLQSVNSGVDPDTGAPTTAFTFGLTMASYEPRMMTYESDSSGLPGLQRSLAKVNMDLNQPAVFGGGGFGGSGSSDLGQSRDVGGGAINNLSVVSSTASVDEATGSGTMIDDETGGKKKKKKKKKKHRRESQVQDTSTGNEGPEAVVNRQEVVINPDTSSNVDNFPADSMDDMVTFSNSPTGSQDDDVGDQLAEGMRPGVSSKAKDRKGMTRRRRKH